MKKFKAFNELFANHIIEPTLGKPDDQGYCVPLNWNIYKGSKLIESLKTLTEARKLALKLSREMKHNEKYHL